MKINNELMNRHGFNFESVEDIYFYIFREIEWLESHNKQYTKEQYHRISNIKVILEAIDPY